MFVIEDTTVNTNIGPGKNHSVTEDASITSEQLLFALTSVPPTETETVTKEEESGQVADKPTVSHRPSVSEAPVSVHPIYTAAPAVPEIKAPSPPPVLSASTPGLGITPATPPPQSPKTNPSQTTITTTNTNETNPSSSTSIPTKTSNSPLLTNATNMNLTNLPDISAALRRLSSANVSASVIEQLSSSSHLPNIGQLNSNSNNERKGSTGDVSPSEILGNALAAVAANARPMPSPKQPHQQPQLQQPSQPQNAQATATAIGNLAAITANISNFLHSGGFHRNSFSQEDTQKLAAAVAVARNTQQQQPSLGQRRKSSMAVVGNAFSNMLDQAILMGRNKSISEGTSNKPFQQPKPKLIIKNNLVWKSLEGMEEKALGFQLYSPHLLLPNLENSINGLMEIRVPARFLTFENTRVQKRALWGTDIYTDDSDIVASKLVIGYIKQVAHFLLFI